MGFINECYCIIRRSNKDMLKFYSKDKLSLDYFDKEGHLLSSNSIINSNLDFTKYYFTLDESDNVYGIFVNNGLKAFNLDYNENNFTTSDIFNYDTNKFNISFPYIKTFSNNTHLLYYVYTNNNANTCALIHHYNSNGIWTENKIDFIENIVLNNFVVIWIQNSPVVFYFNLVNGFEEVFMSRFNINTLTWSKPCQISNSGKNKIYLSVLKDSMNFYHITFCEKIDNGYAVKYINGYLTENKLDIEVSKYITGSSSCMYPSMLKVKSDMHIMWVNYNKLFTSISNDLGKTWSEHEIDEFSLEEDFARSLFFSNFSGDLDYSTTSIFTTYDDIGILGF